MKSLRCMLHSNIDKTIALMMMTLFLLFSAFSFRGIRSVCGSLFTVPSFHRTSPGRT